MFNNKKDYLDQIAALEQENKELTSTLVSQRERLMQYESPGHDETRVEAWTAPPPATVMSRPDTLMREEMPIDGLSRISNVDPSLVERQELADRIADRIADFIADRRAANEAEAPVTMEGGTYVRDSRRLVEEASELYAASMANTQANVPDSGDYIMTIQETYGVNPLPPRPRPRPNPSGR